MSLLLYLAVRPAWPCAAHAQQPPVPVIGFLSSLAPRALILVMPAFHDGLNRAGFTEGRNVSVEYRWAEGDYHRLPDLSADLVRRNVAVIAAISGTPAALAARLQQQTFQSCSRSVVTRLRPD